MKTEKIVIANLKCGGCESTIKGKLMEIKGVNKVEVNHEKDTVTVDYSGNANRATFINTLYKLGYPEATLENGLLLQLKSYASCMVGRFNNLKVKSAVL